MKSFEQNATEVLVLTSAFPPLHSADPNAIKVLKRNAGIYFKTRYTQSWSTDMFQINHGRDHKHKNTSAGRNEK